MSGIAPMSTWHKPLGRLALAALLMLLAACASRAKPDLTRLYAREAANNDAAPVILIPGLMGTTLVDAEGNEVWPGSLAKLAFSDHRWLTDDLDGDVAPLRPGALVRELGGVDIYGALTNVLEGPGGYRLGKPGVPPAANARRQYYPLVYDWRQPNIVAVRALHRLIEQIRRDYGDPRLRVDIVAHSNGGLIANYYLRFGPTDVLDQASPRIWSEGELRVQRVALLGTPNLGTVTSLRRLMEGMRVGVRDIPPEVVASFATPIETLPHPDVPVVFNPDGMPVALDLFEPALWQDNQWSVFNPTVAARVAAAQPDEPQALARLQARFVTQLRRAKAFQRALSQPLPRRALRMAAFGGDCEPTPAGAVLQQHDGRAELAFREADIRHPQPGVDYLDLLEAPGDGLVTRDSQDARPLGFVPLRQSVFLCEGHALTVANPYFQNNLLNFLLRD